MRVGAQAAHGLGFALNVGAGGCVQALGLEECEARLAVGFPLDINYYILSEPTSYQREKQNGRLAVT